MTDEQFMDLRSGIHSTRFSIMQHYLFLYGDELRGNKCKMDLFAADALNELEADRVMDALMEVELEEDILGCLRLRYEKEVAQRNKEMIARIEDMKKGS